jgi:hypothetical protein
MFGIVISCASQPFQGLGLAKNPILWKTMTTSESMSEEDCRIPLEQQTKTNGRLVVVVKIPHRRDALVSETKNMHV